MIAHRRDYAGVCQARGRIVIGPDWREGEAGSSLSIACRKINRRRPAPIRIRSKAFAPTSA